METAGGRLKGSLCCSRPLLLNSHQLRSERPRRELRGYLPSYGEVGAYYALTKVAHSDQAALRDQMSSFTTARSNPSCRPWLTSRTPPSAGCSRSCRT